MGTIGVDHLETTLEAFYRVMELYSLYADRRKGEDIEFIRFISNDAYSLVV